MPQTKTHPLDILGAETACTKYAGELRAYIVEALARQGCPLLPTLCCWRCYDACVWRKSNDAGRSTRTKTAKTLRLASEWNGRGGWNELSGRRQGSG